MNRIRQASIFIIPILGGILPILVYWVEHGGLGAPTFGEYQTMTRVQQLAQVIAGLYIKPTYMLISLALIIGLWGQTAREMISLFWGLTAFLAGEIFCAINFITFKHASIISEYIHSYGMVLSFGFIAYAFLEITDKHIFHVNNGRCTANQLCEICKHTSSLHCAARRISLLAILMTGIASFFPLTASVSTKSYLTDVFNFPYSYARFDFYQWYETRALPLLAVAFFIIAFLPLFRSKGSPIPQLTKIFFSAGVGALGFSLFRIILDSMFTNNLVWFEFWEELTELMFTSAIGFLLWQFRHSLLQKTNILRACSALLLYKSVPCKINPATEK